jgi:hypothetical protein
MNKLSGVLMFISALAFPLSSYTQQKVQPANSEQHRIPHLNKQGKTYQLIFDFELPDPSDFYFPDFKHWCDLYSRIRIFSDDYSILRF